MTDAVVEFLLEKLVTFLENKASLLGGAHNEFNQIKNELEMMKSFLKDADSKRSIEAGVETWVRQVRDASYDVEDIIDEFTYRILGQQSNSNNQFMCFFHKCFQFPKNMIVTHHMAPKLQKIKAKIVAISDRSKRYGFNRLEETTTSSNDDTNTHQQHYGESSLFIKDEELIGFENDRDKLLGWMTDEEPQRTIISVVGMGGSGKTTLVSRAYNSQNLKMHFSCYVWITVSQTYAIEDLFRRMIKELYKPNETSGTLSTMEYRALVETLVNYLQHQRYVVILDDVWDINLWSKICVALPNNNHGSRIMLTTRDDKIANFSYGVVSHVHPIQPLKPSEAWDLFCKKTFFPIGCCPSELKGLAEAFLEKCKGLPLAIVSISGLLSTKFGVESEWRKVYDSLNWELSNNPLLDRIKSILLHSFNDLPYYLKHCFLYCCMFPEDYVIKRKRLIRLWISEGFIKQRRGLTLEDVADIYLKDLIGRNLLLVDSRNEFGWAKTCKMHDIIRELALSISTRDKFCEFLDENPIHQEKEGRGTRRLSFIYKGDDNIIDPKRLHHIRVDQLRSLMVHNYTISDDTHSDDTQPLPTGFRLLRVLDLEKVKIERLPDEICELFNLRYMNLRNADIKNLPKSLGKLSKLQFLDISDTYLEKLPKSIVKLQNLRYIMMSEDVGFEKTKGPLDLCNLKNLQVLHFIRADGGLDIIRQVGNLTQLRRLGISYVRAEDEVELCASIQKLPLLQTLYIRVDERSLGMVDALNVPPPPLLRRLELKGKLVKFPLWVGYLKSLVFLELHLSELQDDFLIHIQALQKLEYLTLIRASVGKKLCFPEKGFLKLKEFQIIILEQLEEVVIGRGAMPSLHKLFFLGCYALKMVPQGIEYLVNIQELHFEEVSNELIRKLHGEDHPRVQHIPLIYPSAKEAKRLGIRIP